MNLISKKFIPLSILFFCSTFFAPPVQAQRYLELAGLAPSTQYKVFETEHFKMIYQEGYLDFTQRAATHLEHAHTILSPILKWKPRFKTSVLVADNADSANGFSAPALRIGLVLIATPPDSWSSLAYSDDWIKLLVFHEYTHMLNIDPTTKWMEVLRWVLGDVIRPNGLWPTWMLEGLAVYYETRTTRFGRGRSPYYDSILRAYLNEGRLDRSDQFGITLDRVNGDDPFFPGGEIAYLFGYHLWNQFSKSNADERMGEYSYRSSHRFPFLIEGNLKNVTGKNWVDFWNAFVNESHTRLDAEMKRVQGEGVTPSTQISHAGYSALGGAISPDGKWLAYTQSTQSEIQGLILKNLLTGKEQRLEDKQLGTGMSFTPDSRYLIYNSLEKYKTYFSFSDLFAYDTQTAKTIRLTQGLRAKEPALSPDGTRITYIQVEKAGHQLMVSDFELRDGGKIISFKNPARVFNAKPYTMIGNPKFLDNDTIVWSLQENGTGFSDIVKSTVGSNSVSILFHDGKMNRFPVPTPDGVLFVSDKGRIENIYRLNAKSPRIERLTNVLTGTTLPFVHPNGDLYSSLMTSNGYEIVRFDSKKSAENKPVLSSLSAAPAGAEASAPQSLAQALESPELKTASPSRDYSPWPSLIPRQWAPLAYARAGTYAGSTIGGEALGFDTTGKHQYLLGVAYNTKPKTIDGVVQYTYYGMRPAITFSGSAETSDIATDSLHLLYRRQIETAIALDYPILWTYSSLHPRLYGFLDWNGVYDIATNTRLGSADFTYNKKVVPGVGASLAFSDAQRSRLGFMPERGNDLMVAAEDRINTGEFSILKYYGSATHYFRVGDHAVMKPMARWLGTSHPDGFANLGSTLVEGKRTSDLSDHGTQVSLKRMGIRGYSNVGTTFRTSHGIGSGSLDFHFPIDRIFRGPHNTLPAFVKQVHGFVFGETSYVPVTTQGPLYLPSYGGGLSVDTTLLLKLPIRFSVEYQKGTKTSFGADSLLFFAIDSDGLF